MPSSKTTATPVSGPRIGWYILMILAVAAAESVTAFSSLSTMTTTPKTTSRKQRNDVTRDTYSSSRITLLMGLYDTPLPPRPPPRPDNNNNNNNKNDNDENKDTEEEDDEEQPQKIRLFNMETSGQERNNLLPPLSRRLDSGIGCYFEASDVKVQNLIKKTLVHPEDACWALEACKGDMTEAWTRISVAQRQRLEATKTQTKMMVDNNEETDNETNENDDQNYKEPEDEWDRALAKLQRKQEFEQRKASLDQNRKNEQRQRPLDPDQQWLPRDNPKPIDDEPWFTG